MKPNKLFWQNKRVFLTGHTGFKGGWISLWLQHLGATVRGYSLPPSTAPSLHEVADVSRGMDSVYGDIRDQQLLKECLLEFKPQIIIHMAAQPLVIRSYDDPIETYSTNVMGTVNILEAVRSSNSVRCVINVTSDKCYENHEWLWGYRETDRIGGRDPYSSSKGCAELIASAYQRSFLSERNIGLASVRAGNVIGGGDWATNRLVPDIINAFAANLPVKIRNSQSIRPWQHVLEPLSGYLILAERLYNSGDKFSGAWNFGPSHLDTRTVEWMVIKMADLWGSNASWNFDDQPTVHEANHLKLDCSKATHLLHWMPIWSLEETLLRIVNWYRAWSYNVNMRDYCCSEIQDYANEK